MNLQEIKDKINICLQRLYRDDVILFERNQGKGLCERCIVFRFALYLQEMFPDYFVDCDFNSSSINGNAVSAKPITNIGGRTTTNRFVDIIIHSRSFGRKNDFICFEVKKWNNYDKKAVEKDKNNLKVLTSEYGYEYGFYLILAKTREKTRGVIFQNGRPIERL